MSLNQIVIAGTIKSLSVRYTDSQKEVASVLLVITCGYGDQATHHVVDVTYWKPSSYLKEGDTVLVQGTLQVDKRENQTNPVINITADTITPTPSLIPVNSVTVTGRAGRDPELRYFESGAVLADVNLAVDRPKKNAPPTWLPIKAWAKTAEVMGNYVRKGGLVGVSGELDIETWSDRATGDQRYKPVVKVNRLALLGGKRDQTSDDDTDF
jgi:single-strand DNA-binding protein